MIEITEKVTTEQGLTTEKIDVWNQLSNQFTDGAKKTKEFCETVNKEANTFAEFFGFAPALEYARLRLFFGYAQKEAAWEAVNDRRDIGRRIRYERD